MYIGQTGRSLKQHVSERRRALKNAWGHPNIRFGSLSVLYSHSLMKVAV